MIAASKSRLTNPDKYPDIVSGFHKRSEADLESRHKSRQSVGIPAEMEAPEFGGGSEQL